MAVAVPPRPVAAHLELVKEALDRLLVVNTVGGEFVILKIVFEVGRREASPVDHRAPPGSAWRRLLGAYSLTFRTARKASWGISTLPTRFMRFLPSFCFSR